MAASASLTANLSALLTGSAGGLGQANVRHPLERSFAFADGSGLNQITKVWTRAAQSLAASASDTFDLNGGGLTDTLGAVLVFAKVSLVYIAAASGNTNNVVFGNDANHVPIFSVGTASIAVRPGNIFVLTNNTAAGWTVTAGTGDILKVTNSGAGTAVVYDIAVLGA